MKAHDAMKGNESLPAVGLAGAPLPGLKLLSPPRILVVDEDSDLCRLYTEALTRPGYQVDAAGDGAAALKALRSNQYQLLITEHSLPTLTGVELVKTLRAARMSLPVIMAATRLPTEELARNPLLQPVAVLAKPFYISQLLETVRTVLRAVVSPCGHNAQPDWQGQPASDGLRL
jgi:DNA-binding response OmpR family regulator